LRDFTRELLRAQPEDIIEFGFLSTYSIVFPGHDHNIGMEYFQQQLQKREDQENGGLEQDLQG